MTARPKYEYVRSEERRRAVAALPCQNCGAPPPSQAAHSNQSQHGKGRQIKASDRFLAALCPTCHRLVDESYDLDRIEREAIWNDAFEKTEQLLEEKWK